jgi:intracellular septation protein
MVRTTIATRRGCGSVGCISMSLATRGLYGSNGVADTPSIRYYSRPLRPPTRGLMNLIFEFLPLILFFGAFLYKDIYLALVVLMIAMPIGVFVKYVRTKKLDKMYFWSTVALLIGGGLTLYFRNPIFLYWKPTVFYWVVSIAFLGSQFFGEVPLVQKFFGLVDGLSLEKITASQWTKLNVIWVLFFVGAGILNIYVAYNFEQATWVKFKVFGLTAITFVFMIAQTFWIASLIGDDEPEEKEQG